MISKNVENSSMTNLQFKFYNQYVLFAKEHGWEVISNKYENNITKMLFKCPVGHIREMTPQLFKRNHACGACNGNCPVEAGKNFKNNVEEQGGKVIGIYVNKLTRVECECVEGHTCHPIPDSIQQGGGICIKCSGLCPQEVEKNFIVGIENLGGVVVGKYVTRLIPVECLCPQGHTCYPIPCLIKNGQGMCKKCSGYCPFEAMKNFIQAIENFGGIVIGQYIDSVTSVKCICKEGHTCFPHPRDIQQGCGMCKKCAGTCSEEAEKTFREYVKELGGLVIGEYIRSDLHIYCICKNNHDCDPTPTSLRNGGNFCRVCWVNSKESYGEKLVSEALTSLGFKFSKQSSFPSLKRLKFDFKFKYNHKTYYIEYDGEQHQTYIQHFHRSIYGFEKGRQRDLLKNYAIENSDGCVLIRLDHSWAQDKKRINQSSIRKKLEFYIKDCISIDNLKIIADPQVYHWINDELTEQTISKYIK